MPSLIERSARQVFVNAYADDEERPIKALFESLAEYEQSDSFESWCRTRHADERMATNIAQYELTHWVYLVAWRMLDWKEFQARMSHARLIVTGRS